MGVGGACCAKRMALHSSEVSTAESLITRVLSEIDAVLARTLSRGRPQKCQRPLGTSFRCRAHDCITMSAPFDAIRLLLIGFGKKEPGFGLYAGQLIPDMAWSEASST